MASWIVHLRTAEILLEQIPGLNAEKFAVGSIAPDSGVPDEKWENFTPPPWVTHFGQTAGADSRLADLEFYRRYLLPLKHPLDFGLISFRLGYFFHLITDNLWSEKIGIPTTQRFSAEFAATRISSGRSRKIGTGWTLSTCAITQVVCSGGSSSPSDPKQMAWTFYPEKVSCSA